MPTATGYRNVYWQRSGRGLNYYFKYWVNGKRFRGVGRRTIEEAKRDRDTYLIEQEPELFKLLNDSGQLGYKGIIKK